MAHAPDVYIVSELFHPSVGGQEVRYMELGQHLVAAGLDVTVLTIDHLGDLLPTEEISGIHVRRVVRSAGYKGWRKLKRNPFAIYRFSQRVRAILQSDRPRFVIFNQWPILPSWYGRKLDCPTIVDVCEFRSGAFWNYVERRMLNGCHRVTTVSAALEVAANRRMDGLKTRTIPSGVNASDYHAGEPRHFLFMGRLEPHKHPEMAIEAVRAYNAKHQTAIPLKIVGGGPMKDLLREQIGSDDTIELCGFVNDEEKFDLLADALLLLLPSVREGFPRVIAEAMASGVPVVTTDATDNGSKDIVEQYKIGVSAPLRVETFVAGMETVLDCRERYSANAMRHVVELDWSSIARRLIEFMDLAAQ